MFLVNKFVSNFYRNFPNTPTARCCYWLFSKGKVEMLLDVYIFSHFLMSVVWQYVSCIYKSNKQKQSSDEIHRMFHLKVAFSSQIRETYSHATGIRRREDLFILGFILIDWPVFEHFSFLKIIYNDLFFWFFFQYIYMVNEKISEPETGTWLINWNLL